MVVRSVAGVVRGGQVTLTEPLALPDGTAVTVTECEAEPLEVGPSVRLTREVLAELAAFWRREKTWEEAEQRIRELQARP